MPAFSFCSLFLAPENIKSVLKFNLFLINESGRVRKYILHPLEE
jgi:hypothetical protein